MNSRKKIDAILGRAVKMSRTTGGTPTCDLRGLRIVVELIQWISDENVGKLYKNLFEFLLMHPPNKYYVIEKYNLWIAMMATPLLARFLVRESVERLGFMPRWDRGRFESPLIYNCRLNPRMVSFYLTFGLYSSSDLPRSWVEESWSLTRRMLAHGGNINAKDIYTNRLALFNVIDETSIDRVEFLLAEGADPTCTGYFCRAVEVSCSALTATTPANLHRRIRRIEEYVNFYIQNNHGEFDL